MYTIVVKTFTNKIVVKVEFSYLEKRLPWNTALPGRPLTPFRPCVFLDLHVSVSLNVCGLRSAAVHSSSKASLRRVFLSTSFAF